MKRVLCLVATLVLGLGCDSHSDEHHEETPMEALCEGIDKSSMTVLATEGATEEATAEVHVEEHPHTVTLAAGATGYVWFHLEKAGDTAIGVRSEGTVAGFLHEGNEESIGEASVHGDCPSTFDVVHDVKAMEAGHWHIKLQATDKETTFEIVVTSGEASHDDGGDHEGHNH